MLYSSALHDAVLALTIATSTYCVAALSATAAHFEAYMHAAVQVADMLLAGR
jgi:hypothetical protein